MAMNVSLGTYDYVICGGGTAGLVLASRLTETPSISVAVVEAGIDRSDDLNVLAPGLLTALYGNPDYDWIYTTTPQPHANNRTIGHPRGKQLGGSSAINYLAYTHASQRNVDDWGALGNEGWSWADLEPFYRKAEHFSHPSAAVTEPLDLDYLNASLHGERGPIVNGFPRDGQYTPLDAAWPRAYETLGIAVQSDPKDGLALGGYMILTNLDTAGNTRSYAANTYLAAAANRSNLHVFTSALVEKVLFDAGAGGDEAPVATGVALSINGTKRVLQAKHEVVLSAGSFGSPQILELSGIGAGGVLAAAGIDCLLDNSHVGENLQDHVYMPLGFAVNAGIPTLDDLANDTVFTAAYDEYLANATGLLATVALGGALLSLEQVLPDNASYSSFTQALQAMNFSSPNPGFDAQYRLLRRNLFDPSEAVAQHMNTASGMNPVFANDTTKLFAAPTPGNWFTILAVLEHPFSRGSVHVSSANASVHPAIDPEYLSHPVDVKVLSRIALHVQNYLAVAPPLAGLLGGNGTVLQPAYTRLTEANVESEIRRLLQSEYHPVGTCAMMPREKGGVVDSRLKVHGVKRLRVVDASVFPMLPRANLQTAVYAVAERAAGWIREDWEKDC